jgi:hypothetical protein
MGMRSSVEIQEADAARRGQALQRPAQWLELQEVRCLSVELRPHYLADRAAMGENAAKTTVDAAKTP